MEQHESDLESRKRARAAFMNRLYNVTNGGAFTPQSIDEIAADLGQGKEEAKQVASYLKNEHLLEFVTDEGAVVLTHEGLKEIEAGRSSPDVPTDHFSAYRDIITYNIHVSGDVNQSQFAQGSPGAQQTAKWDTARIADLAERARSLLDGATLNSADRTFVEEHLGAIEKGVKDPTTDNHIRLRGLLHGLVPFLATIVTPGAQELVRQITH